MFNYYKPQGITLVIAFSLGKKVICFITSAGFISNAISTLPYYSVYNLINSYVIVKYSVGREAENAF